MALRRRHTQTNGDGASSHKTDYVGQVKEILNLKGPHLFKSYDHYTEWVDFAYWWSCIGKGQSAACKAGLFILNLLQLDYLSWRLLMYHCNYATTTKRNKNTYFKYKLYGVGPIVKIPSND